MTTPSLYLMAKTDDPVVMGCEIRVLGPFIDIVDFFPGKLWRPPGLGPPVQKGGAEWGSEENILPRGKETIEWLKSSKMKKPTSLIKFSFRLYAMSCEILSTSERGVP